MQQEHALEEIYHRDCSTSLVISSQVGQLIVCAKSLTTMASTYTSRQIILTRNDILIDGINRLDIVFITCEGCHIGNTGIHIAGTHGMAPSLGLLQDRLVALGIEVMDFCLATIVKQEFRLIEIFLIASNHIKPGERHLCNLMPRHYTGLTFIRPNLLYHTVSITLGNIEELGTPSSLIVGTGGIHHVAEVIELMTQHLFYLPTLLAAPLVRMLGINRTGRIEIAVRLLRSSYYIEHRVYVSLQFLVRICLQHIRCTLYRLIDVGIIETESHKLRHIPLFRLQPFVSWMLQGIGCHLEVLITMFALAFRESQRNRYFTSCLNTVSPECIGGNLNGGEWYLGIRIPALGIRCAHCHCHDDE